MCASIDGLKTLTKALLDAEPWEMDPDCVRMPWSDDAYRLRDHGGEMPIIASIGGERNVNPRLAFGIM
jgi:hypothetical protein